MGTRCPYRSGWQPGQVDQHIAGDAFQPLHRANDLERARCLCVGFHINARRAFELQRERHADWQSSHGGVGDRGYCLLIGRERFGLDGDFVHLAGEIGWDQQVKSALVGHRKFTHRSPTHHRGRLTCRRRPILVNRPADRALALTPAIVFPLSFLHAALATGGNS